MQKICRFTITCIIIELSYWKIFSKQMFARTRNVLGEPLRLSGWEMKIWKYKNLKKNTGSLPGLANLLKNIINFLKNENNYKIIGFLDVPTYCIYACSFNFNTCSSRQILWKAPNQYKGDEIYTEKKIQNYFIHRKVNWPKVWNI
jgi:hypothetical protein